jgi:hypothetical protein
MNTATLEQTGASPEPAGRGAVVDVGAIVALDVVAIGLWLWAASETVPTNAGAAGLIQALPPTWWAGAAALSLAFVLALEGSSRRALLFAQPVLLIVMLYATPSLVEAYARNPVGYVHVGLVDHVVQTGKLLQGYDARFEWPGAIALGSALTSLTGVASATAFLKWSPPFFALLWSLPTYSIARSLFEDRRVAAVAVWLAACINWVGQEYWSPQAVSFFLLLTFIAAVLRWAPVLPAGARSLTALFGRSRAQRETAAWALPPGATPTVIASLVAITAAVAVSHQLTPFVLVIMTAVLVVVGRRDLGVLPLVLAIIAVGWFSWGATSYWDNSTNHTFLTGHVGQVSTIIGEGVTDRAGRGSGLRTFVLIGRILFSGIVWAAALLVAWRGRRSLSTRTLGLLMIAPMPLVALQSYGGELVLRLFLFSAPFAAALLARAAIDMGVRPRRLLASVVALVLLIATFVVCRYGNEQFEQVYPEDIAAARFVNENALPGTVLVVANPFTPLRTERITELPVRQVLDLTRPDRVDPLDALDAAKVDRGFLLITHGEDVYGSLALGGPQDWGEQVVQRLLDSGRARVMFHEGDAYVVGFGPAR